jgi:hypothetical protein
MIMFNPYNNYMNNFAQPNYMQPQPQPQPQQNIIKVHGFEGAQAFNMAPNSNALLLDESNPIIYIKTTDGAGYPTIKAFTITPYQEKPQPDFQSLEARITHLEEVLNNESNITDFGQSKSKGKSNKANV